MNGRVVRTGQIEAEFTGFDGESIFSLTDGTHWVQAEYKYWYHYVYRPSVVITEHSGTLYLTLTSDRDNSVAVRRIDVVESRIVGEFNGWDGDSEYTLDNGQTWKQDRYKYRYKYAHRPRARIYNAGGGHVMEVAGTKARVRRVR